ncbi:hypothetical protein AB6A40_000637 [Gnathostoma spinigerum]|uniref:Male-enhanced antigen 1 n=1 Tax=Gnathostoma spinigerum TaxID=75299 RepID=A0ABD6E2G7_9BILA
MQGNRIMSGSQMAETEYPVRKPTAGNQTLGELMPSIQTKKDKAPEDRVLFRNQCPNPQGMGPNPLKEEIPYSPGSGHPSDDEYEQDGWHRGYDVEMNIVGGSTDILSLQSDSDDENDVEETGGEGDDRERAGYQVLPSAPESEEPSFSVPMSNYIRRQIDEISAESSNVHLKNSDFKIEDVPKEIELTDEKIASIKKAMKTFILPTPDWAKNVKSDEQLLSIVHRMKTKHE